jgi:NADH-ubiquinone oxidoreductase chain 5
MGMPFLTGFYSKDVILEVAYANYTIGGHIAYYLGSTAAFFTAFYSTRLLFLVFLAEPNGNRKTILNAHEGSWHITLPLFILAIFSVLIGFLTKEIFIGFGTNFWSSAIFILPENYLLTDIEFIDLFAKLFPLILTIMGAVLAYFLYSFELNYFFLIKQSKIFKYVYTFINKKWYFDRFYNQYISQKVLNLSYTFSYQDIDRGILEKLGPWGIVQIVSHCSNFLKPLQNGAINHSLLLIFLICSTAPLVIFAWEYICYPSIILFLILVTLFYDTESED